MSIALIIKLLILFFCGLLYNKAFKIHHSINIAHNNSIHTT